MNENVQYKYLGTLSKKKKTYSEAFITCVKHIVGAMTAQHSLSSCFLNTFAPLNMLSWDVLLHVCSTHLCLGEAELRKDQI